MQPEMPLPQTDAVDSAAAQPVVEGRPHRAGFVNIIGNPNVGKSTLMNALVGERLSIITSKAQTTRHRIMGIVNGEDYQIVYSDTPGILKPAYNADIILYVTDVVEKGDKNREYVERLCSVDCPVLIVINKIDLSDQQTVAALAAQWSAAVPHAEVFAVSALEQFGLEPVFGRIVSLLPEGEPWYDKDFFTDRNLRFFASEIIREKILTNYDKEIPYCTEVVIEEFKENADRYDIRAVINVMRDSQKGIIIGARGASLKRVGTQARIDMEDFFQKKVFLQLYVKVNPHWRDDKRKLAAFGY